MAFLIPPIFRICNSNNQIKSFLGNPVRVYSFGETVGEEIDKPYLVWQNIGGEAYSYLSDATEVDRLSIQIDIYSDTAKEARDIAKLVIKEVEKEHYISNFNGESRDPETKDFRFSFDADFHTYR